MFEMKRGDEITIEIQASKFAHDLQTYLDHLAARPHSTPFAEYRAQYDRLLLRRTNNPHVRVGATTLRRHPLCGLNEFLRRAHHAAKRQLTLELT